MYYRTTLLAGNESPRSSTQCYQPSFVLIDNTAIQGHNHMIASYLPSILVPLIGLVLPAVAMTSMFLYIEQEEIA
jgi:photosystem I subunit 8